TGGRETDAQPLRPGTGRGRERPVDLGPISVAGQMAGNRVEARGCVRDRARDHAVGGEARPVLAEDRAGRDPAAAGLEADGAAAGGRDADRAAAVGAVGEGAQTRRDRGGGASARATRRILEVPWVSGRAEETVLGGRPTYV